MFASFCSGELLRRKPMKEGSLAVGSTLAAFLASLCCLGPLLLGGAGLGAILVATFAPIRPYFLAVSAVLLAGGFYFVYHKPKAGVARAGETCTPESRTCRITKPLLWLATLAVAALAFFPSYGIKLIESRAAAAPSSLATLQTAELKITGMDCPVCSGVIQRKLLETPEIVKAQVRYPDSSATIQFDPSKIDLQKVIATVNETGYKATPANSLSK
jgi:mercuric ion transport protein